MTAAVNVDWPYADLATTATPNFTTPITDLLTKLQEVGKPSGQDLQQSATPYSVQVITAGATSLSKVWAAAVGVLGGGSAIVAGVKGLVASGSDPALYRASFLFSAAVLAAAVVVAIAIIVRADVSARAEATAARALERGQIVAAFLANYVNAAAPASKPCTPCGYLVQTQADAWLVVDEISWQNGGIVVVAGNAVLGAAEIQMLVDVSSLVKAP